MTTRITVQVSTETLDDARHEQGANFKPGVSVLLDDGCVVEIETSKGIEVFNTRSEFEEWFDGRKAAHAEYPDSADDSGAALNQRFRASLDDPKT